MARNFNFNHNYCNECDFRKEKGAIAAPDNKGVHCPAVRKSNPRTFEATLNVVKNNGEGRPDGSQPVGRDA